MIGVCINIQVLPSCDLHLDVFCFVFSHLSERKMGFTCGESALIGCSLAKRHIRRGAHPRRLTTRDGGRHVPMRRVNRWQDLNLKCLNLKRAARSGLTIKGKKKKKENRAVPGKTNQPSEMLNLQADLQAEPCDKQREENKHSRHHLIKSALRGS